MDFVVVMVVLVGVVITGVAAYLAGRSNGSVSFDTAIDSFRDAVALVDRYAPAADQLVAIGELQPEQRRAYVIEMVKSYLPDVDIEQVKGIVEAWVAKAKLDDSFE